MIASPCTLVMVWYGWELIVMRTAVAAAPVAADSTRSDEDVQLCNNSENSFRTGESRIMKKVKKDNGFTPPSRIFFLYLLCFVSVHKGPFFFND